MLEPGTGLCGQVPNSLAGKVVEWVDDPFNILGYVPLDNLGT